MERGVCNLGIYSLCVVLRRSRTIHDSGTDQLHATTEVRSTDDIRFYHGKRLHCLRFIIVLVLRCCAKVLVEYIQVEVQGFQEGGKLQNIHLHSQSQREIEATRLRMNNIRKLKESFNEIWEGPLILACASTIMVDCVVLDAMFHDGIRKELWLAAVYSLYSSLCFIDLAYTGQSLIDEVGQGTVQDLTTLKSY